MTLFPKVLELVHHFFGESSYETRKLFFRSSLLLFENGVKIAYDEAGEKKCARRCVVDIPATALEVLPVASLLTLVHSLDDLEFKCTRVDESFDDFDWLITPQEVLEVVQRGDCGGYRAYSQAGGGVVGRKDYEGFTLYLGKRGKGGSGRLGRIYDKNAESDGEVNAVRWEVEWSKERAAEVFKRLAGCFSPDELAASLAAHVGGAFDFPIRNGDREHVGRCQRYGWWVELQAKLGRAKISAPRKLATYETMKEALKLQWSSSIAVIEAVEKLDPRCRGKAGMGFRDFIAEVVEQGLAKAGRKHREIAASRGAVLGAAVSQGSISNAA